MSTPAISRLDSTVLGPQHVDRSPAPPKVVITMPAYQAERTLERTVLAIPAGFADELILVDDASRDGTADLARSSACRSMCTPSTEGTGPTRSPATRWRSNPRPTSWCCCIPTTSTSRKPSRCSIAPILAGDADMTFGSRFAGMGDPLGGGMPGIGTWEPDHDGGAEPVARHPVHRHAQRHARVHARCSESLPFLRYSEGFAFDAELLVDAVTSGQRVVEVPIPTRYTEESSSISILRSLEYVSRGITYAASGRPSAGGEATDTCRAGGGRGAPRRRRVRSASLSASRAATSGCPCATRTRRGDVPIEEFRCTTSALGIHDDILSAHVAGCSRPAPTMRPDEIVGVTRRSSTRSTSPRRSNAASSSVGSPNRSRRSTSGQAAVRGRRQHRAVPRRGGRSGLGASGIEPSAWAVEQGRERFGVDLRQGAIETLELEARLGRRPCDADVLEHLPIRRAFAGMRP